ncbi:helix-turn-helix domain-containing protein [Actinomyces urogenitalis]|uniref:helix-turn-helix domain-containing protein n=1 Tax=Actinomyces urogenitalis TaxID=103621 RepID=UPI002430555E|nr:helix-turn-helix domain-containing protein [Actinomyces urogenitalis]MCI7456354.1 helix-turn-helix domain-containing protein [Actinomyces urogenitalis]
MSARVTAWVWDSPVDDMAECMVLLALAGQANDDGDVLTVSLTRLARQCRMGQETLRRALDGLEERGFLTARTRPSQWCWSGRINLGEGA